MAKQNKHALIGSTRERSINICVFPLTGVERHAITVLERYLQPIHEHKLQEAKQAMEEKEKALREVSFFCLETVSILLPLRISFHPHAPSQPFAPCLASFPPTLPLSLSLSRSKPAFGTKRSSCPAKTKKCSSMTPSVWMKPTKFTLRPQQPMNRQVVEQSSAHLCISAVTFSLTSTQIFAPPQPAEVDDPRSIHYDVAHVTQYRVGKLFLFSFDAAVVSFWSWSSVFVLLVADTPCSRPRSPSSLFSSSGFCLFYPYDPDLTRRRKRRKHARDMHKVARVNWPSPLRRRVTARSPPAPHISATLQFFF